MFDRPRVFACVTVRRAVATQRYTTCLTRPQMDPGRADLDAFFALMAFGERHGLDLGDVGTDVVRHI